MTSRSPPAFPPLCGLTEPMEALFSTDSRLSGRGDSFRGGLVVASNREPCAHRKTARGLQHEIPAGGLVSALDTVLRVTGGTWVAWGSGSGDREGADEQGRLWVPPENPAYTLRRVWLSPDAVKNYYQGFCNRVLWPLFHGETDRIRSRGHYWDEYRRVNRLFAAAILQEAGEDAAVWVHDYHLCLVPALLRAAHPQRTIAHFWHVPWPEPELFAGTAHAREIIAGLLGNDLIGFQIPAHADNFLKCAEAYLGASVDRAAMTVSWQGRLTRVRAFPISIDFTRFNGLAGSEETAALVARLRAKHRLPGRVALAVDRLDYTKGIRQRLRAIELFFRRYPDLRGGVSFVQIAVMTRREEPYRSCQREIAERIAGINAEFGTSEWQPVLYLRKKLGQEDLVAWYRLADLALVTPLRDGMNLVAKEYLAARHDGSGALILGTLAGAAAELPEALLVDPNDTAAFVSTISRALAMPGREQRKRMAGLRDQVRTNTIFHWVGTILDELALLPVVKRGARHALSRCEELQNRCAAGGFFLFLDFDGTLAPIVEQPEMAVMPDSIRSLVEILREHCPIAVISGRCLQDLKSRVALPGLIYGGNHGAELEGFTAAVEGRPPLAAFLAAAQQAFAALPGVQIEDKCVTASIHFRRVEPVHLEQFLTVFQELAGNYADTLLFSEGRKVFEIRPPGAFSKGDAVLRLLAGVGKGRIPVYVGDDSSDEDGFRAVRETGIAVAVGGSPEAEFYLRNQGEVADFLALLAGILPPVEKPCRTADAGKVLEHDE
ncbi:MAG: bifunctional alpha,alpha-trehalose-phosphate synthase (UDP-forming)/trehalose-phosphatase [Deltaproteobacteria bacterium]|nr:bifunctional alpha,alpha-trehalose-phosphate synthase (UDP-forming)/trehalose-phosphatase [Deltaproteobacteria bacterium]TLN04634.1 MAG: bifunctional alpha,alpha-trehalose-phosphate synthase (UDP-forming)/trehalose-phosphatase [bacterium]